VEVDLVDTLASDERIALLVRERFGRDGGVVEISRVNVYRVRDDRIVEISIFEPISTRSTSSWPTAEPPRRRAPLSPARRAHRR
jgi:hypothetical protein